MFRRSQVPSPTPPAVGSSPSSSFELDPPRSPPDDANEQSKFVPSHRRGRGSGSLDLEAYGALLDGQPELQYSSSRYPLPRNSSYSTPSHRGSLTPSELALDTPLDPARFSRVYEDEFDFAPPSKERLAEARKNVDPWLIWNESNVSADDYLHEADPAVEKYLDRQIGFSFSRMLDSAMSSVIVIVIVGLFAGWPIYNYAIKGGFPRGTVDTITGRSIPGQVPNITGLPGLIDGDTPTSAYSRTGYDGNTYNLVFSDEFNVPGRTFWPGDDPWWEAGVDLHYSGTDDYEWYDPDAIVTADGDLVITLSEEPIHDLNFRSGMLQSWNKFCFTGGYVELNASLPGNQYMQGFWPAAWLLGNLARGGYQASTYGTWPYSYSSCDAGAMPNQTVNGTWPAAAKTSGSSDYGGELSWLPGQRLSACTCPEDASEHPGPSVDVGRGAPEIDIIEGQIDRSGVRGSASQSVQIAPIDAGYLSLNQVEPNVHVWNTTRTTVNTWNGSIYQQSYSWQSSLDATSYEGRGYSTFGVEYIPGPAGTITWDVNSTQTWELTAPAMGPDSRVDIGQRLVSEEPMSIILNLGISNKFQQPLWGKMVFPGTFRIDYVRVYQTGTARVGCDPSDHPTSKYISDHPIAYQNMNVTMWPDTNYTTPRNSLSLTGCS